MKRRDFIKLGLSSIAIGGSGAGDGKPVRGAIGGCETGLPTGGGGGAPTARDYVQDGLIAMWDGIENAGWGVHDANAAVWKDLIGTDDLTVYSGGIWGENCISNGDTFSVIAHKDAFTFNMPLTQEIIFEWKANQAPNGVMLHISQWYSGNSMLRGIISRHGEWFILETAKGGAGIPTSMSPMSIASTYDTNGIIGAWVNGDAVSLGGPGSDWWASDASGVWLGNRGSPNRGTKIKFFAIRYYSRALTAAEIAANYAIDKERFGI